MTTINSLTPEQEELIPVYREKWQKIAFSTENIDRTSVIKAIKAVYAVLGKQEPTIIFFDSPYAALKAILLGKIQGRGRLKKQVKKSFRRKFYLGNQIWLQLCENLVINTWEKQWQLWWNKDPLWQKIRNELLLISISNIVSSHIRQDLLFKIKRKQQFELYSLFRHNGIIDCQRWTEYGCLLDYCISVLNWSYQPKEWSALQLLIKNCGWVLPYEQVCCVCNRPTKLSLDSQNLLHAEGEAAIEFADGYKIYAYRGVIIPEKYGFFHPHQWESQWLLQEDNVEIKRVLIDGIGYAKICQELAAIEIDSWREYTLLRIDNDVDVEPIYLLKMSCPSTGFIHALRVPPQMRSAREAIGWVNWGVDPEEFAIAT